MGGELSEEPSAQEPSRRDFIVKYGGMAFAGPVIASFAFDGLSRDKDCDHDDHHPGQTFQNSTVPVGQEGQKPPKSGYPNSTEPKSGFPNSTEPVQKGQKPPKSGYPNSTQPVQKGQKPPKSGYPNSTLPDSATV